MANPSPTVLRSGLRRALRAVAALLAGVLVTTCADNPTAPNRPGFGSVSIQPGFDQYALFAPVVLNQVRAIVVRPPSDTVVDTLVTFRATDAQLRLTLRIPLQATSETMGVGLQLLAGNVLLFSGSEDVVVRQGVTAPATSIPMTYQGPGANATSLTLDPDTTLRVRSTAQMRATARDIEGVDVGQFYLNWSIVGTAPGATIDATGLLHAPTSAGTFFVRGITPGGLRDSVQITVLPAPSTLAKSAGDAQTALVGTRLANPLVVLVTGAGGVPVPGVTVSFTATTGGGTVDSATATTNAQGLALSGVTLGAATGAQTFTVSSTGLASVVFTATAQGAGPQTRTWSGAVSTDFSAAGNWVGGVAPAIVDGVIIGAATNQPSLTATTTVGSVTINSGGALTINNQTIVISGNLTTAGTGVLRMLNSGDGVGVTGNAVFGGGDESGLLTAGVLQIGGSFTQTSGTSTNSFRATGSHATAFTGTAPSVTFASGSAATSSFQSLAWTAAASSTMTLGSAVFVKGSFSTSGGGATGLTSTNGSRLTVLGDFAAVLPLVLNNVPVTIDQATAGTVFAGGGLTFLNMATNVSQLVIRQPGLSSPITLAGMTFSTVPVAPNGFYLDLTDITADANVLTVNLTGATPASGGAFVRTTGGAIVNWPLNAAVRTWTGAVSNNWSVAGNWNGGVPGGSDSAVIVAATNAPQLSTETSVGAVSITGGTLLVNGHGLSVARGLSTSGTGVLVMSNPSDEVSIAGNATFGGGDASDALIAGDLTIGGNLVQTSANSPFSFSASGTHVTLFTSGAHTISFASPDALVGSGFNDLEFAGNSTTTLTTVTWARGSMDINGTGQVFTSSNGSRLGIERLITTAPVTFNNVPLLINQSQATAITDQPLTFQNMATNVVQLEVRHPGGSGPLTLTNFVFSTTPVAPNGFYLSASDNVADATPLVITMVGATPATGAPFVQTAGGATVNWASSATLRTWTGAINSDWTITNNWLNNGVPQTGDDVLIPEGTTNFPLFTGIITLRNLTIDAESGETILTVNGDGGISVTGNLLNRGQILGTATIALVGTGPHQVEGDFANLSVLGPVTLTGRVNVTGTIEINGAGSVLNMSNQTVTTGQDFVVVDGGSLTMNPSSNLVIGRNASFDNNSMTIVGGDIQVAGDFFAGSTDGAFAPGNGNSVSLTGAGDQTVTLGSGASFFDNLAVSKSGGNVILGSDVTVFGTFGGGGVVLGAHTLTVGLINAGNVTFNGTRLVWNSTSADPPFSFNNFTFENYSAAAPQFTINHPGVVGNPITLNGITFSGTPNPFFLQVNDNASDGVPLIVNLTNANPASGAGLFNVTNGATVNWPPASTVWAWTGATGTNWSVAANWDRNSIPPTNADVTIGAALNQPTLSADVSVNSVLVSQAGARLTLGGHTLTVAGNFTTHTDGLLVSTNPADRLIVGALAAFQGGDETGLITAGELRLNGSFIQQVQTSPFSFLASGSHRTILTNTSLLQNVQFCCTANTSKFMNLDISNSFGINIQFAANGVFVADTFIVQPGAGPRPWLYMLGSPLTARRFKINRLLVDRGTLTLNENGVAGTQQLDSVTFQNYLTTQTQLAVTGPGTRTLTFNNLVFQALTTGNTGRYLNATASTGTLTLDLTSANVANGPAFTTINGNAIANWPGSTPVNTWSGAVNTAWTNTGNWSLGRLPAATDSVVIPNAVTNFPTLTGRQTVGAMFVDGRLLINGGVLVVNRSMPGNNGVNRIIQLTQATDSLIVTGSVATGISATLGVAVINGDLTGSSVFATGARLVLSGAGTQNVSTTGGLLVVNKPTGTAVLSSPFNGDSIDVISGSLDAPSTNIVVATGLSSRAGTSVSSGAILQVGTNLTVLGNYSVNITRFKPQLAAITIPILTYTNLYIEQGLAASVVSLGGRTVTSADVLVTAAGTPVELNLNGHTLVVGNNLSTSGPGIASIRMNNAIDSLLVFGSALFGAPANGNPGYLTAGVLQVGGSFTQTAQNGGAAFQATGTHKTILTAFSPTISMDQTGQNGNQSRFQELTWTGAGTLTMTGNTDSAAITGKFTTTSAGPITVLGVGVNRNMRFAALASSGPVTFNNIRIIASQPNNPTPGADIGIKNVTFANQDPSRAWLTIQHPGFTGGLSLNNLTFNGSPTTGFYISATDDNPSDGLPLVVNVTASTPASPSASFLQTVNGATINYPFVPAAATWTGTASAAWENPANWNVGAVPGSITAVTIPAGTPFAPTAGAVVSSVGNLTVASGATLTLASPFNLAVSGNVDAQGTIAPNSQALSMIGANVTLRGNVPQLAVSGIVTLNGNTTAASNGPCVFNGAAELIVNGFTFSCFQLQFNNTARIQMTNPADSVVVLGSTQFSGGSTAGRLTAGVLDLRGSFQQTGTNSVASFASTGTRVRVSGTGATTFAMGTGGPGQSQFRSLLISRTGGTMTMSGSLVYVTDSMIVSSAIPISIPGTLNPNKLRLAAGAGLTGAGSIQINGDSLFVATPANYTIANTNLYGTGAGDQKIPALPYAALTIENSTTHTLTGRTTASGPVFIVNGTLVLGGRTLSTAAGFVVDANAQVQMTSAIDSLLVGGNAFWQTNVDGTGNMTAGVLRIAQNMTVTGSTTGFAPSGTHKTILASVLTSNVNWTGLGTTPIQFQNLEANANNLSINYARVNGTMNVTGTGGMNVATLNVRGQLTTASTAGMGIDSLYLGAAVPIAPGSGRVAANVYILDNGGTQSIPTLPIPTAGGADSAALVIRSNITVPGGLVPLKALRIDGSGRLDLNGQTVNVNGDFWTADNGTVVMQNAADRLNVTGTPTFGGGDESGLLIDGIFTTSGRFTQDNTNSNSSFVATGNHTTRFTSVHPDGNIVFFASPQASAFMNLETSVPITYSSNILIFNNFTNSATTGTTTALRMAVQGNYTQSGGNTFTPRRFVFYGTFSTGMTVTAGSFRPDTIQFNDGLVPNLPVNANIVYNVAEVTGAGTVVTLGATAPTWNSLTISGTAQLNLNGRALNVAGPLIASAGTILGNGAASSLQARRFQVTALTVDNARLILDEQGTTQAQTITNIVFQNLATPTGNGLFSVTAVGNNGTPRSLALGINFNTTVAGGQRYLTLASSNSQSLTANVSSNVSGAAVTAAGASSPVIGVPTNGATIVWP